MKDIIIISFLVGSIFWAFVFGWDSFKKLYNEYIRRGK